ncbi:MAG: sensor domain-containing diguanylate cyclase [Lachnospiraceae bacterium]|nr:sensor domain-containing diguanylate cyclase [Lachnospiraceae bacterium]
MKNKSAKEQREINILKGGNSFYSTLVICLFVFFLSIAALITAFNNLISMHDKNLSGKICTLVTEKMNHSIDSMTQSASSTSHVLSAQGFDSPSQIYEILNEYGKSDYLSIGFLDSDGSMYATDEEKIEFKKWDLKETALRAKPVSMSMPYRSALYGKPVVTVFSQFEYGNEKHGYLFLTYSLGELQKMAATQSLDNDIEIWLMNSESANIIQCAGGDEHAIGSWNNAYLVMQNIDEADRDVYREWIDKTRMGANDIGISYSIGDTLYTQFCSRISSMPGWYVAVRIPSNALSATMSTFRNYVLYFLAVLMLVVVVLITNMYRLSKRENKILTQLSIHDSLTGVLNRRAFDFAAEEKLSHSKGAALIFFDIDYFKQVNDQFGHDAGDRLLVAFSDTLKNNFSDRGIISRFGGDEFVVLTDMSSFGDIAESLVKTTDDVRSINLNDDKHDGPGFMISFSAGAAAYPKDADTLSRLKKCADMALYATKEKGRNGYSWFAPDMADPKANRVIPTEAGTKTAAAPVKSTPVKPAANAVTREQSVKPAVTSVTREKSAKPAVTSVTREKPAAASGAAAQAVSNPSGKKVVKKVVRKVIVKKVVKKKPTPPADQTV